MGKSDNSIKNRSRDDSSSDEESDYEEIHRKYGDKPLSKSKFKNLIKTFLDSKADKYFNKLKNNKNDDKKKKNRKIKEEKTKKSSGKKNRKKKDEESEEEDDEDDYENVPVNYIIVNPSGGKLIVDYEDDEDDDEYDEDYEEESEEDVSEYTEDEEEDSEEDEDDSEEDGDDSEEDGDDSEEDDDDSEEDDDDDDDDDDDSDEDDVEEGEVLEKSKSKKKEKKSKKKDKLEVSVDLDAQIEQDELNLKELKALYDKNKNDIYAEAYKAAKKKLKEKKAKKDKGELKIKQKNNIEFKNQLRNKNKLNDAAYFLDLSVKEQTNILEEFKKLNALVEIEKPYRISLLESDIPAEFKAAAIKKINTLKMMEPGGGEYYKIKNWIDTFMSIPFGKYKQLTVSADDGVEKCHDFMENAKNTLDTAVYGLNDAKMQIMQLMGQFITNPSAVGSAIAIQGPMGTGKTTMVKEGISKILGRDFEFIALGGATDSSFLEGHSYTYEGSTWGQIVNILIKSKSMNPVIYFDELDKVSDTPKGEEIIGILTHLTDTSQNTQFHDKYFSEIDFDLSKCLFIFSYNDITKVNPILRDRMYNIQTKGYDGKEKIIISRNHILPKIREQVKFNEEDIIIDDDVITYLIDNYTLKEEGLRNLKRCYEIIYTKLNLYRLMRPGTNLFEEDMSINVEFPFQVTKEIVDKLIKKKEDTSSSVSKSMMYL